MVRRNFYSDRVNERRKPSRREAMIPKTQMTVIMNRRSRFVSISRNDKGIQVVQNCCRPNNSGTAPNMNCDGFLTVLSEAAPMMLSVLAAIKTSVGREMADVFKLRYNGIPGTGFLII